MTDETLLSAQNPLPASLPDRLRAQWVFLLEVDKLKTVLRQSPLAAAQRRENDAEHSWHLALMVPLLAEYADEPIDVGHTIELVVVHDLIEIYAGDTPLHGPAGDAGQQEREQAAADQLFPLLPSDQAERIRRLWDEFEQRRTPEARFAKALDRLQPILLNWMALGGTWASPGVTAEGLRERMESVIGDGSQRLWEACRTLIDESERRGWVRSAVN